MGKPVRFFLVLIGYFSYCFATAQSIQNVKASPLENGKVTITYDIVGGKANQKFIIELYGSHNNFRSPLTSVSGDVGKDVVGGPGRRIIWSASDELDDYKGEINFRVKGSAMAMPMVFLFPGDESSARRGKKTDLKWEGGTPGQNVKLELYKGVDRVSAITETKNTGTYNWSIPKDLAKGSYTLRLIAGQENVSSPPFTVKAKIPLVLKVLPVLVIGGVVAALGGGSSKTPGTPAGSDLPVAPDPK